MKKLLIGIVVVVALGAGAVFYLSSNAGTLVRDGVVEYVPPVIGAPVDLASVDLDAVGGMASLNNMVIHNPVGFKSEHLFKMEQLLVKMDVSLDNLTSDVISISEVRLEGADMIYEIATSGNNVGKIQENIDAYMQSLNLGESEDSEKKFIVDHVYINGTNVSLASDLLAGKDVGFSLPNLHITDIGKRDNGAIASDVIKQIFAAISGSATDVAQSELLKNTVGDIEGAAENVVKDLEDKVVDEVSNKLKGLIPPM
ncbi:MAG: hypothetical protein HOH18_12520 [Kordiimonadaceae bacterium]|jgi:hypothetical protein|nr:hypothetical protein [Kordiimonadaceae bacterium]MBT6037285.1 hypothetical protein [Kordiimonadaceae bacterium]MBT7583276.1 hypothetical protein [Kordiimonadaceae bacterium]